MFALPSNFMCVCVSESEINDKLFEVGHVISVVVRRVDHEVFKRFSRLVLWEHPTWFFLVDVVQTQICPRLWLCSRSFAAAGHAWSETRC